MQLTYRIKKLNSGGYVAFCPAMEPVKVFGKTEDEASKKLVSVAKLYLKAHPDFESSVKSLYRFRSHA